MTLGCFQSQVTANLGENPVLPAPGILSAIFSEAVAANRDVNVKIMSINRGIDKEDVIHIYNRTLLSYKKE